MQHDQTQNATASRRVSLESMYKFVAWTTIFGHRFYALTKSTYDPEYSPNSFYDDYVLEFRDLYVLRDRY